MKEVMVLRELEQIKAISNPYRIEVIESFEEAPATAKKIADKMGEPHAKVNYHIKALLKVGILELVEEKVRLGIVEKFYMPSARTYVIDRNILNNDETHYRESMKQVYISMFENVSKDFYKALEMEENSKHRTRLLHYNDYHLTLQEVESLQDSMKETIEKLIEGRKTAKGAGTQKYSISTFIVPKK